MDAATATYVALDAVSLTLAWQIAAFFWRSHRLAPRQGLGVLATAFGILGVTLLSAAVSAFGIFPETEEIDAVRTASVFLTTLLIALAYALRWLRYRTHTRQVVISAILGVTVLFVLVYAIPGHPLGSPLTAFPWLRLLDALLLVVASLLALLRVHARRLRDLQVPAGFLCLAFSRYTAAILGFEGVFDASPFAYAWRLLGLVLLSAVTLRRWPRVPT